MPKPRSGESEGDFVARCVPIVMGEGSTQKQALGKCYGLYRNAKKEMNIAKRLMLGACCGVISKSLKENPERLYKAAIDEMEQLDPLDDWKMALAKAIEKLKNDPIYYKKKEMAGLIKSLVRLAVRRWIGGIAELEDSLGVGDPFAAGKEKDADLL